jgi:hypothetical protein
MAGQGRVPAGQIAEQGHIGVAVGPGPADNDLGVEADKETADGIRPEKHPAFRAGIDSRPVIARGELSVVDEED